MEKTDGLALLRKPFSDNQTSKLPKPTKKQTDDLKANINLGIRCHLCGGWHHKNVVHLDYVGHAALTDRLLEADPEWNWEFLNVDQNGLPILDKDGGMWIKLTVCGVTRLGYGDAGGKSGGDAMKERIGDCLRNAAMRYGAALDLWHKGDLHQPEDDSNGAHNKGDKEPITAPANNTYNFKETIDALSNCKNTDELVQLWGSISREIKTNADVIKAKDDKKALLTKPVENTEEATNA